MLERRFLKSHFFVLIEKKSPHCRGEKNVNKSKSMTDNVHVNHISHKNIFLEIQSQMCTAAHSTTVTLFRNKMFMLGKNDQTKFAIVLEYENLGLTWVFIFQQYDQFSRVSQNLLVLKNDIPQLVGKK